MTNKKNIDFKEIRMFVRDFIIKHDKSVKLVSQIKKKIEFVTLFCYNDVVL